MKRILLLITTFLFVQCEVIDNIFGGDKSTCQCQLEVTFTDLVFGEEDPPVLGEATVFFNSGQLSCEEYFNNPPSSSGFTATSQGITESFVIPISDIPEFNIKNAECVGDIIDEL